MQTAAVLGASANRAKFGNKAVRAFLKRGYQVYPVNPSALPIEGLTTWRDIRELPVRPGIVSAYLPPAILVPLLQAIAVRGCDELWLNPGTDSDEVLALARKLGLKTVEGCGLIRLGFTPADFP